ncbi:M20/M25/M40 family metallo-hydrolase [Leptobacterium flavescens]|uniref:M20/M25/M40 family metallo-hydrolase n=1 Tax=Leptobacterium flavescens TaxID=472055 RepID=A0A6P0UIW5_9FLAO|nr:M28 family metallopeptidase [Leptobacterium flavescens]NER11858.1 M20/M25/M40 family metallo-hydrolase [Leptobacterium flavescens]
MKNYIGILVLLFIVSCQQGVKEPVQVEASTIGEGIEKLASDDFQGRMPFTEGETKTVNYLKEKFSELGLSPGNGDSYFQEVPLVEITGTPSEKMEISGGKEDFDLTYSEDFVALTLKTDSEVSLEDSELVFAGYGVVAPEYGWNDYEGIDWTGKTAVVLVNDPGFATGDSTVFKGKDMTYYGRWTYKYEEAGRQGAAGVIIIHETKPASYGWNVVQSSWSGARLNLESDAPVADVQGWITSDAAKKLFEASSLENKDFKSMALDKDFKPVPLGLKASVKITNEIKRDASKNVVALLPGTERKDEYIIYSAHWDHLGVGRPVGNDSIYNGAVDNASGTACLLAIAEAFKKEKQPKRSILFIAVTAEEQGLLGSAYYAENPIYDPKKTVANINMDAISNPGPMKDLTITGYGHSEMDEYAREIAEKQGRYIIPDPEAEKGYFFRSDHFNFAKIGIPALYASGGYEDFEHGIDFVKQMNDEYLKNKYHQPLDEYDPETFELSGIQFDAQLMFEVGLKLSNEDYFPKWYDGSEFKAAREK